MENQTTKGNDPARKSVEVDKQKQASDIQYDAEATTLWQAESLRQEAFRRAHLDPASDIMRLTSHPELLHQVLNRGAGALGCEELQSRFPRGLGISSFRGKWYIPGAAVEWRATKVDGASRMWREHADEVTAPSTRPSYFEPSALDRSLAISQKPDGYIDDDERESETGRLRLGSGTVILHLGLCGLILAVILALAVPK